MSEAKKILVLGVGNILLRDEGVGVRVVEKLLREYDFADNVTLLDGGTLGMRLIDPILQSEYLVVVDAVLGDGQPGDVYRLTGDDLRRSLAFKNSLHQADLVETLVYCDMLGNRPETVVIGVQPVDYSPWSDVLSPAIAAKVDRLAELTLAEIGAAGGQYTLKARPDQ